MAARTMSNAIRFIAFVLRPLLTVMARRDWQGADRFPADGFVLAANHISHVDPFTLGHFCIDNEIPPRYLAKASLVDMPILGRLVRAAEQIPVYRETDTAVGAFSAAVDAVRAGGCIIVYPEGTITRDPDLWPMGGKTGAARISLATGCPVLPVAQWGPQEILEPYGRRLHLFPRKTVHVRVGPPVDLDDLRDRDLTASLLAEATNRIMDAISVQVGHLRGEPVPAERISLKDPRARMKPRARRMRNRDTEA